MSEHDSIYGSADPAPPLRRPFPFARLVYAVGFAFVAWVVFWLVLCLALLQFVTRAVTGEVNGELKYFSGSMIAYLQELLSYISLARDERPFPIGPFPKP